MRELAALHRAQVIDLWERCDLSRPWNPAEGDFDRAVEGPTSAVLGGVDADGLAATVMVGDDGHRGWIYYLAVESGRRGAGVGRRLMQAAERWLAGRGVRKVELMVRAGNGGAADFYAALDYRREEIAVFSRWLVDDSPPTPGPP